MEALLSFLQIARFPQKIGQGKLSRRGNFAQVGNNANSLTPLLDSIRFPSWQGSARRNPHLINRVRAYYAVTWFARGWQFERGGDTKLCFRTYLYSQRVHEPFPPTVPSHRLLICIANSLSLSRWNVSSRPPRVFVDDS